MKNFFVRVWLCCTKPSSYKDLTEKSFWRGSGYLYWLLVLTTFCTLAVFTVKVIRALPVVRSVIVQVQTVVPTLYPEELVLTFKDGELSTNVQNPYVFPFPAGWEAGLQSGQLLQSAFDDDDRLLQQPYKHILTIDTTASVEDYSARESVILVTKTAVVARDNRGLRVIQLKEMYDSPEVLVFDHVLYKKIAVQLLPLLDRIPGLVVKIMVAATVLLPWLGAAVALLWYWFYLLIATLLAWALSAFMRRGVEYGSLYRLGLYALTPALVIQTILIALSFKIPFLFTVLYLVTMGLILQSRPRNER